MASSGAIELRPFLIAYSNVLTVEYAITFIIDIGPRALTCNIILSSVETFTQNQNCLS